MNQRREEQRPPRPSTKLGVKGRKVNLKQPESQKSGHTQKLKNIELTIPKTETSNLGKKKNIPGQEN